MCLPSRPGLLNASDPGYPWLADSWPATSLPVNSSSGGPNDLSNFGRGGEWRFCPGGLLGETYHKRWKMMACLAFCSTRAPVVCPYTVCLQAVYIYAYCVCVWIYVYISHQRTARALTAGPPLSPGWVMANSPAWCHSPYLRARECEGRDGQRRQRSRGWMGVWKDGLEQPVVKDRRSLTGADADTSAMALHHLPFTRHANHALRRESARCFPTSLSFSFPLSSHTCRTAELSLMYMNREGRGVRYPHMQRGNGAPRLGGWGFECMNNWDDLKAPSPRLQFLNNPGACLNLMSFKTWSTVG